MSSTAAGGTAVEYYSSVPTFIPPTSFSDTGVPTFDPSKTPSPQPTIQDLSSPPSSNHAHPTTPSPPPESSNPYAHDPWAPQANQSIKVDSLTPPKSPNLGAQRKIPSRFAVPAPSTGAAGYMRRAATEYTPAAASATSPRVEQEELGLSPPVPAVSVTPSESTAASKNAKGGMSKDSLSKSFARLSFSLSGRSKSGKKNSPPAPAEEPVPQPLPNATITSSMSPTMHQRPMSMAGSPAPSVRPRSFVIPQTLEEWEAFNKAMLVRPPASHQRPPSTHLRPPSSSSGAGMLPGPRLAATLAASPLNSPGASPRRSVVDLPPPPIVLGEWEKKRLAEAQGIPFPQAPSPSQQQQPQQPQSPSQRPGLAKRQTSEGTPPPSEPSTRPTTPSGNESKRSSLFFFKRGSSGAVSPGAVNTTPTPFPLPKTSPQEEQSPSPSRVPSPKTVAPAAVAPAAVAVVSTSPSPAPASSESSSASSPVIQPLSDTEAAVLRARTVSLPEGPKPTRPLLAPIQTDVSSPSIKWSRPKSWKGVMGGGSRARRNSVSEGVAAGGNDVDEYEVRPRVVSVERRVDPNSNGARLKALRRSSRESSLDLTTSGGVAGLAAASATKEKDGDDMRSMMSEGGRLRNLLKKKRRPSSASESGAETGSIDTSLKAKLKKQQPQGGAMALPPGAAQPMLGKGANFAVSPGATSPPPAAEAESKDAAANSVSATEKRRSRRFSFGMKNLSGAIQSTASGASGVASPAPPATNTEGEKDAPAAAIVPTAAPATSSPAPTPAGTISEKTRSRRFSSFGLKNTMGDVQAAASPAVTNDAEGEGQQASKDAEKAEKRRSRRFSFGLKNAQSTPSSTPATDAEADGQQPSKDEKRRSRRFSFGMKNPFNKSSESSAMTLDAALAVNPHSLLPPGAAKPAIPSRAGSQGTVDTVPTPVVTSSSSSSKATTPPAATDSFSSSIKPPTPPPTSPLAASLSRSANNSSQSLAAKMNPFKRKPPPSLADEPFVIVPTLNKGKGKLKLEISDAEKERLERMTAPPSLPDSRPQTPSDNTLPVKMFGSGKRSSFFGDGDDLDKEEKIDESNNRVSRFLSQYAANNELGLAIPSPSLKGMPLAPSSMGDSTANSITATDSTDHSDLTARGKSPDRFEY